jgi:hypothetical protein
MDVEELTGDTEGMSTEAADSIKNMFADMSTSIPGVDEAMSFAELMKMVQVGAGAVRCGAKHCCCGSSCCTCVLVGDWRLQEHVRRSSGDGSGEAR